MPRHQDEYLYNQLIPYIGNKRRLLPLIRQALARTGVSSGRFLDLFAGSTAVARLGKWLGYTVLCNDWEPYSRVTAECYIGQNRPPAFAALKGMEAAFHRLNHLPPRRGYIARHYCPADDEAPDPEHERMFYTQENGRRIDAMREQIAAWRADGAIDAREEAVLLAPLIFQAAYCSNTSGVFKAFHHGWGGRTGTALYRIRSRLTLSPPLFFDNGRANRVYCEDALELAKRLEAEIIYLDPPYNQHQYGANYHLLNTVALWDCPAVSPTHRQNGRSVDKAAIRQDWKASRRSLFCSRQRAADSWVQLVARCRADWILVSYSSDGIVPLPALVEILCGRGQVTPIVQTYKRYRVSTQRFSPRGYNLEGVFVVETRRRGGSGNARLVLDALSAAAEALPASNTAPRRSL
ncbi:DNA adenine methylase [bacterium]|nr:DNA adenine methylase [bacterium]